jgi:hypothetical protein
MRARVYSDLHVRCCQALADQMRQIQEENARLDQLCQGTKAAFATLRAEAESVLGTERASAAALSMALKVCSV